MRAKNAGDDMAKFDDIDLSKHLIPLNAQEVF